MSLICPAGLLHIFWHPLFYGLLFFYVDCGKKLCGSLDHLFQIYQRAVVGEGTFKFSADDSLHVVEALRYNFKLISSKIYDCWDELKGKVCMHTYNIYTVIPRLQCDCCPQTFAVWLLQNFLPTRLRKPSRHCACQQLFRYRLDFTLKKEMKSESIFTFCWWCLSSLLKTRKSLIKGLKCWGKNLPVK